MAAPSVRVWVWGEEEVATYRIQGRVEETWAALAWGLIAQDQVSAASFNGVMMCWPLSLYRKLEWGDLPHFGDGCGLHNSC